MDERIWKYKISINNADLESTIITWNKNIKNGSFNKNFFLIYK